MNINIKFIRSEISNSNPFTDYQKKVFLEYLSKEKDITLSSDGKVMFFIESGGTEEIFKRIYKDYKEPYIFIATDANNSLPATLEIASFLRKSGLSYSIIHDELKRLPTRLLENLSKNDVDLSHFKNNVDLLKGERLGVVGYPSDWLISSDVNYSKAKEKFGVELIDISFEEFKAEIVKKIPFEVDYKEMSEHINATISKKDIDDALFIYSALKSLIKKYRLNGVTVRCFDLLSTVKATSCLALALLNKEGITATCEGDIPAMLSMHIIMKRFHQSSFQANPSYIKEEEKYLYLAHCTLPLDMVSSYRFDTHFESGIGLGIKGEMLPSDVTIFKFSSNLEDYLVLEGRILDNLDIKSLCRSQIKVEISDGIETIKSKPCGNHLIVFYGHHKDEIISLLK